MGVQRFSERGPDFVEWVRAHPRAFVVNLRTGVIHRARCTSARNGRGIERAGSLEVGPLYLLASEQLDLEPSACNLCRPPMDTAMQR